VDHQVTVGGTGIIAYNPNQVTAAVGDTVTFTFMQKNHTATQSTLQNPCQPVAGGFDSGFIPVADATVANFPNAVFTVETLNPVWVYCRQTGHCQQGMVFAINPGNNFAAFQAAATGNSTASTSVSASASATAPAASATGSTTPTSNNPQVHQVVVGGTNKIFYTPSNITAAPGDVIMFQFQQKNHTITQSSFATPCRALALTSTSGQVGFDSGFMPVADDATTFPTWNLTVNDTSPIWAYCRQPGHCGSGMVFSVNSVESGPNNFAAFQAAAEQQNGSTTATSSASSSSGTTKAQANGASMIQINRGAGIAVALVGVVIGSML